MPIFSCATSEWLFTMIPGMFGLIPGLANLTGWGLLFILFVMVPCSLPFVRKTGYFEVQYLSKLLEIPKTACAFKRENAF